MSDVERQITADSLGLHERASATPAREGAERVAKHGAAPEWTRGELTLRAQQEWFAAVVSAPESEAAPIDDASASRLVSPSKTLSSLERIEIYRRGYHARLIECLTDDYPVLAHTLGEGAFEALCRTYIARHPSRGPSLNYFGRHMAELCRADSSLPAFCADLATLEWAIVLGIHAPTAPALGFEDLAQVPPERWPGARFEANPSLSVLSLNYPVNAYLQSFRDARPALAPEPGKNVVAVYRTGKSVWRLELDPALVTLVQALVDGATLGAALEGVQTLLADRSEEEAAALVSTCFRHAVSSGLFSTLVL
ncbi:MAG TPA: DNA-binding domain-containing protein [Polyangiaceae bacterium]|nr:DNA-binding domain-containing protein [Polyangiaceae bacterium]